MGLWLFGVGEGELEFRGVWMVIDGLGFWRGARVLL